MVDEKTESLVYWGKTNQPYTKRIWLRFGTLHDYAKGKSLFASHLQVGSDKKYGLHVHAITEYMASSFCT